MNGPFGDDTRSNLERMRAGDEYIADAEIDRRARRAQRLAHDYTEAYFAGPEQARAKLEELLGEVGADVDIRPPFFVDYGSNITIGEGTFVNFNLTALDVAPIVIGRDCQFGPNVQLLTPTHPIDAERRRARIEGSQPIVIGDNVWLGGGVIVLPGVTIGSDTVIGAGAVVSRSIPSGVVAVGNPARVVRTVAG